MQEKSPSNNWQLSAGSPVCPQFWRSDGIPGPTPAPQYPLPGVTTTHTDSELGCVTTQSQLHRKHNTRSTLKKHLWISFSLDTLLGEHANWASQKDDDGTWGRSARPPLTSLSQSSPHSWRWMHKWALISKITQPRTSLVAQTVKHLPTMWETRVRSLGWEDPLQNEMATNSSNLAWRIPWTDEPCRI